MAGRPKQRSEEFDELLVEVLDEDESLRVDEAFSFVECYHGKELAECRTCLAVVANYSDYSDLSEEAEGFLNRSKPSKKAQKAAARKEQQKEEYLAAKAAFEETGELPEGWYLRESMKKPGNVYIAKEKADGSRPNEVEVEGAAKAAPSPSAKPKKAAPSSKAGKGKAKQAKKPASKKAKKAAKAAKEFDDGINSVSTTVFDGLLTQQKLLSELIRLSEDGAFDTEGVIEQAEQLGIKIPSSPSSYVVAKANDQAELDQEAEDERPRPPLSTEDSVGIVGPDGIELSKAEVEKLLKKNPRLRVR